MLICAAELACLSSVVMARLTSVTGLFRLLRRSIEVWQEAINSNADCKASKWGGWDTNTTCKHRSMHWALYQTLFNASRLSGWLSTSIVAQELCLISMHRLIFHNGLSIRVQNITLLAMCAALTWSYADKTFGVFKYECSFNQVLFITPIISHSLSF